MLWKKVMPRLSAGRVQSVATRLVVDRERERIAFRARLVLGPRRVLDAGRGGRTAAVPGPADPRRRAPGRAGPRLRQPRAADHQGPRQLIQPRPAAGRGAGGLAAHRRATRSTASTPSPTPAARTRRSGPRRCSRRPAASSASPPSGRCRWPRTCTRPASSPTCVPTRSTLSDTAITAARATGPAALRRELPAGQAAGLHLQGQERAGGARGDPAGR